MMMTNNHRSSPVTDCRHENCQRTNWRSRAVPPHPSYPRHSQTCPQGGLAVPGQGSSIYGALMDWPPPTWRSIARRHHQFTGDRLPSIFSQLDTYSTGRLSEGRPPFCHVSYIQNGGSCNQKVKENLQREGKSLVISHL